MQLTAGLNSRTDAFDWRATKPLTTARVAPITRTACRLGAIDIKASGAYAAYFFLSIAFKTYELQAPKALIFEVLGRVRCNAPPQGGAPCGKPRAQLSPLAYVCSAEGYVISGPWERRPRPFARKEFAMLDNATLHNLVLTVLYYASPLLLLAGVAGFATSMAMWFIRR